VAVLELVEQVAGRKRRVHGHPAAELYDLGVDHLDALLEGYRDAVVAVLDEVGVPDLEQADGGQLFGPVHDLVDPPPAGAEIGLGRQESPVEVPVAPDAADDLGDGHLAQPEVDLRNGPQGPLDLVEGEQLVGTRVSTQVSAYPPQKSLAAGA
jgi:hypothetical protein